MSVLDGVWRVERTGGALPPLYGVEKRIAGGRGETRIGPLPFRFDVDGLRLRYRLPLAGLVDELEPEDGGYRGRALLHGRELGRFRMWPKRPTATGAATDAATATPAAPTTTPPPPPAATTTTTNDDEEEATWPRA